MTWAQDKACASGAKPDSCLGIETPNRSDYRLFKWSPWSEGAGIVTQDSWGVAQMASRTGQSRSSNDVTMFPRAEWSPTLLSARSGWFAASQRDVRKPGEADMPETARPTRLTDAVEKGKNDLTENFPCEPVETSIRECSGS